MKYKKDYSPNDYEMLMPSSIGLEESIKQLSFYFKQYGSDILSCKKWISWGEIAKYP